MGEIAVRSVKTDRFEMHYCCFGTGAKTMIMIPGVSSTRVLDAADFIRDAYQQPMSDFTVYCFERKEDMEEGYSVSDMADDLAQACISLGLKDLYLFGVSQGGMIALSMAEHYPELINRAAVISTLSRQNEISRATFTRWVELAKQGDKVSLNRDIQHRVYSQAYYRHFEDMMKDAENGGDAESIRRFGIMAQACLDYDSYDELDKIKCHVIVIGTWEDRVLGAIGSIEIAEKLKCPLIMSDAYGHAYFDECFSLKDEVRDFFNGESVTEAPEVL